MYFGKTPSLIEDALCLLTIYITGFPGTPRDASFLVTFMKERIMLLISLDFYN